MSHPYLTKKAIRPHGARAVPGLSTLAIPLTDTAGTLRGLQYIAADGTKKFLYGSDDWKRLFLCTQGGSPIDILPFLQEGEDVNENLPEWIIWDLLVMNEGRLVAALEFKSQVGPSFGNNSNNRAEEAIGTGHDFATAYREGAFGEQSPPFLSWFMLLEDAPGSSSPVRDSAPHFPVLPEFQGVSYAQRYNILCRKLVQERLYTTTSILISPRSGLDSGEYRELSALTGLKTFVTELAGHVAAETARTMEL